MTTLQEINDVLEKELEVVLKVKDNYAQGYKDATKRAMGLIRSHPYQSERDKVLDELAKWVREYDTMYYGDDMPIDILRDKFEELRQAGEPDA